MKVLISALAFTLAFSVKTTAQATPEPSPVMMTTYYIDFSQPTDTTYNLDSLITYYVEKGIKPNPMIKNYRMLAHWWGADNSKFYVIYEIDKFEHINKAADKTEELINATFKTSEEKKLFWKRWGKLFNRHEDSIMTDFTKGKM